MIASHHDIENLPGFLDWFAAGDPPSRVEPVAVAHVEGLGCAFSRPLTEEERADILALLRDHADKHREPKLFARLSAPLAEITGTRMDEVRTAVRGISDGFTAHMDCRVLLMFGSRSAAEQKQKGLGPRIFGTEILEEDGKYIVTGCLQIPLDQSLGTVAEIQKYIEASRKEIGDVKLDAPPVFVAEVSMGFQDRASAQRAAERVSAVGLTADVFEPVTKAGRWEVVRWQWRWLVKAGRVEELLRPGVMSRAGFLGEDERLDDILKRDASTLSQLGVTAADVAGRLREVVGEAIRRSREDVRIQGGFTIGQFHVRIEQWMGFQECPWHCEAEIQWASIDFEIKNLRSGETLEGPGLIAHLIDKHGFFEGRESPYRVDPAQAAKVLELTPA